jgi:ectoine hydroxylase-related dioxygenase (phytanoyl-CoA dioxygenase family)
MSNPAVARVASDERMLGIARRFVGVTAVPFRATLFEKTGQSNWLIAWHQDRGLPLQATFDMADWGPWTAKDGVLHALAPAWALDRVIALRLHLDDSTVSNGPLRVIPGSHQNGVLQDAEVQERASRGPEIECTVTRGGVIAMRPLMIHASSKCVGDLPRRVLHIEYADALELASGIRLAVA